MGGKRGLGIFYGGWLKPKMGIDDDFDIPALKATIKLYEDDVAGAQEWITKYTKDKITFARFPQMVKNIDGMIETEKKGMVSSLDRLVYLREQLAEEEAKEALKNNPN